MPKKFLSIVAIALLINLICALPLYAQTPAAKELLKVSKLKAKVESFGPKTAVVVQLEDGANLKGYVSSITDQGFAITDLKSSATIALAYTEVKNISKKPSTGAVVAMIAAGVGAGIGGLYLLGYGLSKCGPCIGR